MIKADDDGCVEIKGNRMDVLSQLMGIVETLRKDVPVNMILGPVLEAVFPDIDPLEAVKIVMEIEDRMGVEHGS